MCFYDEERWQCGFARFVAFRVQCPYEYRVGEVCGIKLVYQTYWQEGPCKLCELMSKKERRIAKMDSDLARWQVEGGRDNTVERTLIERQEAMGQLFQMRAEHAGRDLNMAV